MTQTTRKLPFAAALLAGTVFSAPALADGAITRIATVPLEAEITGMHISPAGDFFFNAQHPADSLPAPYNKAMIGVVAGANFNGLPQSVKELPLPSSDADKQKIMTSVGSYQIIAKEGDLADMIPFGLGAIVSADGKSEIKQSNDPDFNAFIPLNAAASEGYLFTAWEDRPGGMSRIRIAKEGGQWQTMKDGTTSVDFSGVNGTWVNCFGTKSPWGTPLTSEELYFDDTADWNNAEFEYHKDQLALEKYLGHYPNPYDYGYIVEITDPAGSARPVKHFTLGRFSHENGVVMPDNRTVYLTDDGTDVVIFKFVADRAGDLSAGTLYAAKVAQDESKDPAKTGFNISWIELAHGTNSEIEGWVREYDGITPNDFKAGATSYLSDEDVAAWARGEAKDNRVAFLESRKAAAAKGATAEFRKMEGVNISYDGARTGTVPYMYMAMSEVSKGMADDEGDIQVEANKCGAVYEFRLDSNFNTHRMVPVVAGGKYDKGNKPNACPTDGISNPDNILVLDDGRVLIGEDTGNHENNALWLYTPPARPAS